MKRTDKPKSKKKATPRKAGAKAAPKKKSKTKPSGKPKRLSALDAAAQVLKNAGKPMWVGELITAMAEQGLWKSPHGKTPASTLHAAMMREIRRKGDDSRFRKVDCGLFALND